jgi:AcrR family transcriptional regulator
VKVRTEARRDAIVAAATALFQEMGYERASMNELTKRFGGSKATLYGYFPSKEALFTAVVRASATSHLSEAIEELSAKREDEAELAPTLTRFADRMLRVLTNDKGALAVYRMVVAEAGHSDVGQLFHDAGPTDSLAKLAEFLGAAMARGELRKIGPELAAAQFMALVTAETSPRIFQRDPPPLSLARIRQMARRAVETFLHGAAA